MFDASNQITTYSQCIDYFFITAGITSFDIYIVEITYQLIDFGSEKQNMVMSMPKFLIKSNGWSNRATSIVTGVVGSQFAS